MSWIRYTWYVCSMLLLRVSACSWSFSCRLRAPRNNSGSLTHTELQVENKAFFLVLQISNLALLVFIVRIASHECLLRTTHASDPVMMNSSIHNEAHCFSLSRSHIYNPSLKMRENWLYRSRKYLTPDFRI